MLANLIKVKGIRFLNYLLYFFLLIISVTCSEEPTLPRLGDLKVPICTGFLFRGISNEILGHLGSPNIKMSDATVTYQSYPNPVRNVLTVSGPGDGLKYVWLTQAETEIKSTEYPATLANTTIKAGGLPVVYVELNSLSGDVTLPINISNLQPGVYRLYIKSNDKLFWNNILIQQ